MILYVNNDLTKIMTKSDYVKMLQEDVKKYGFKDVFEASENDKEYRRVWLNLYIGDKVELRVLNNTVEKAIKDNLGIETYDTPLDNMKADDILDDECIDYILTPNYTLRIEFKVEERYSEEEYVNMLYVNMLAEDSIIKITNIFILE